MSRAALHVHHQQWPPAATGHTAAVIDHVSHSHRQRGVVPLDHHTQGVPHQNDVHPGAVQQGGEAGVVGGQTGEFFTVALVFAQGGEGDRGVG